LGRDVDQCLLEIANLGPVGRRVPMPAAQVEPQAIVQPFCNCRLGKHARWICGRIDSLRDGKQQRFARAMLKPPMDLPRNPFQIARTARTKHEQVAGIGQHRFDRIPNGIR
jgi:hypothetical protein